MRKRVLVICMSMCVLFFKAQSPLAFSIYDISPTGSITCTSPFVSFIAKDSYSANVTYSWSGLAASYSGSHVSISVPGTYTVTASVTNVQSSSTLLTVGINTTVPVSSLSSLSQVITCGNVATGSFNAFGNLPVNASHNFISPYGGTFVVNAPTASYKPAAPGTYTHVLINTLTGCETAKTFTLAYSGMSSGFPTFNLSSQNINSSGSYTYGCGSNSFVTVQIDSADTSPTLGGPVSYTLIGPSTSTIVPTSGILGNVNQFTLTAAGEYTAIVRDNMSLCESRSAFSVIQNTAGPALSVIVPLQVLNCNTPTVELEAASDVLNISYTWNFIGTPGSAGGSTIDVSIAAQAPTSTLINMYTLTATNDGNKCITTTIVPIYQNIFPPTVSVSPALSSILTCSNPTLTLMNQSQTGIPPGTFSSILPVTATWFGPQSSSVSSSFIVSNAGIYTITVKDMNNGCTASNTNISIFDGMVYPMVNNPSGPLPFCINSSVTMVPIYALVSGAAGNSTYSWTGPSLSSIFGTTHTETVVATAVGIYSLVVTNTVSGCSTIGQVIVKNCITGIFDNNGFLPAVSLYPNPSNGVFTIDCETIQNNTTIKIINVLGNNVSEQALHTGENLVDLSTQADGIYFIFILENNTPVHSVKLIKN